MPSALLKKNNWNLEAAANELYGEPSPTPVDSFELLLWCRLILLSRRSTTIHLRPLRARPRLLSTVPSPPFGRTSRPLQLKDIIKALSTFQISSFHLVSPTPDRPYCARLTRLPEPKPSKLPETIDLTGDDEDEDLRRATAASLETAQNYSSTSTALVVAGPRRPGEDLPLQPLGAPDPLIVSNDDRALSQAVEASLKASIAADVYEEVPSEREARQPGLYVVVVSELLSSMLSTASQPSGFSFSTRGLPSCCSASPSDTLLRPAGAQHPPRFELAAGRPGNRPQRPCRYVRIAQGSVNHADSVQFFGSNSFLR